MRQPYMAGPALSAPPPARSHCLNGLPVHRSVVFAPCPGQDGRQAISREPSAHIRYMPTLEWSALALAKRGCRRGQRLVSSRVMINEHAQKLWVKHGYYTYLRLVGVSARSRGSRHSRVTNFYDPYPFGVCGFRHQTLTTARRHDAIPGQDKHRDGDIDRADPGIPHTLMVRRS